MKRDGLFKRNKSIFAFRYQDKDGLWCEKSTGQTNREEAKKFKIDFLKRVEDDTLPTEKAKWNVEQACTRWVDQHAARLASAKTKRNERSFLAQLVRRLGAVKLRAVTLDTLKDYQGQRCAEVAARLKRKEAGARACNLELQILVRTLTEANLWKGAMAEHYKRLPEHEGELVGALTVEELDRIEATARTEETWLVAYCAELLAANCGIRGGEIKQLRMGMVDIKNRQIRIPRKITKTNAGARLIELNQAALAAATRLYRRAQLLGSSSADHYFLPADLSRHTHKNDPLKGKRGFDPTHHQASWNTAWRSLRKAAGFPQLRFHNLRHTFITLMAENGTPLAVTQAMVGHMGELITRRYTHISDSAARRAVDKLDREGSKVEFVDDFVDDPVSHQDAVPKLLN
jgi:integrase